MPRLSTSRWKGKLKIVNWIKIRTHGICVKFWVSRMYAIATFFPSAQHKNKNSSSFLRKHFNYIKSAASRGEMKLNSFNFSTLRLIQFWQTTTLHNIMIIIITISTGPKTRLTTLEKLSTIEIESSIVSRTDRDELLMTLFSSISPLVPVFRSNIEVKSFELNLRCWVQLWTECLCVNWVRVKLNSLKHIFQVGNSKTNIME